MASVIGVVIALLLLFVVMVVVLLYAYKRQKMCFKGEQPTRRGPPSFSHDPLAAAVQSTCCLHSFTRTMMMTDVFFRVSAGSIEKQCTCL